MVTSTSELRRRPHAVVERVLDRRQAMAHRHLDRDRERDVAAGVLDQPPGCVAQMGAVDVFVAGLQQACAAELDQGRLGVVVDAVRDGRHAGLARDRENLRIETGAERERQQLVAWS